MSSISSINSMQGMMGMSGTYQSAALTDEQKTRVQDILSNYDADNITADDAKEIFKKFKEEGITPTKGLKEAIEEAGFDAESLRQQGLGDAQSMQGAMGAGGPPPMGGAELTEEQTSTVEDILADYDPDSVTEEDAQAIFEKFRDAGIMGKGLKETIEAAGFDAEQLREWGMPQNGQPDLMGVAASSTEGINTSSLQTLQTILSQYDLNDLSDDDQKTLSSQLQSAGLLQSGNMLNIGV